MAVLIFRKGYEKHDQEKAVQKILYLWTNHEKKVYEAALSEHWKSMTEYKIQGDTDLWRSRAATVYCLEQLSLGSGEDYSVGGLGCTKGGRQPQSLSTLLQSRTSIFPTCH